MTVQTINKSSIAVFMDLDELSSEGICIEEINANRTMMLAKQAFQHIGLQIEGELEVEAYINNQCIMVFASIRDKITDVYALYRFSAFEDMLSCVLAISEISKPKSTLLYYKENYYLALHEEPCAGIKRNSDEFGESVTSPEIRFLHLIEHGETICLGNALRKLTLAFGKA
ncbi:MAG: adaptor protein MecA [Clostridiales bacterium]|jgi:negative regulator of genetic competence, sporulation and motility|nr:adaptor protein MecA [Clostridiales bacterium]